MEKIPAMSGNSKKVTSGKNRAAKERTPHPAQFPEDVIERIIKASSNPGDLIFDPFLGSGTTALTALRLGRSVIGIEIQANYCEIAASRIDNYLRAPQQILFSEGKMISLGDYTPKSRNCG